MQDAIDKARPDYDTGLARAAIRAMAAAALQMCGEPNLTWERVALWLEREANR